MQDAGYRYHRMDGSTPVIQRARLMDDFNDNDDVFVFLLTTKVGGIGVNLTGADRVLVYDPDWCAGINPPFCLLCVDTRESSVLCLAEAVGSACAARLACAEPITSSTTCR